MQTIICLHLTESILIVIVVTRNNQLSCKLNISLCLEGSARAPARRTSSYHSFFPKLTRTYIFPIRHSCLYCISSLTVYRLNNAKYVAYVRIRRECRRASYLPYVERSSINRRLYFVRVNVRWRQYVSTTGSYDVPVTRDVDARASIVSRSSSRALAFE